MAQAAPFPIIVGPSIKGPVIPAPVNPIKPIAWTVDAARRRQIVEVCETLVEITDTYLDHTPLEMRRMVARLIHTVDSIREGLTVSREKRRMDEVRDELWAAYKLFDKLSLQVITNGLMRCALYLSPLPEAAAA